jgi:prepilin-type processing-associated H-X9-DG protein
MKKKDTLTLVGLCVVFFIISFLILLIYPIVKDARRIATRVICPTNLKGLGTAMTVYANDYKDNFPRLQGVGPWSKELGFDYFLEKPDFKPSGAQYNTSRTITASWYLLIRYTDVSPKYFVCPFQKNITEFDGSNPQKRDMRSLWDFGPQPHKHVSYVMHNPYGLYPPDAYRSAAFAIGADMSPYFENGDIVPISNNSIVRLVDPKKSFTSQLHNSLSHDSYGQNVLYADGHTSWENRPDVGVKNDNIYTYWSNKTDNDPNELYRRIGQPPTGRSPENDAKDKDDSFLAI